MRKILGLTRKRKSNLKWVGGATGTTAMALLGASAAAPVALPVWLIIGGWSTVAAGGAIWSYGAIAPVVGAPGFSRTLRKARKHEIPILHAKLQNFTGRRSLVPLETRKKLHGQSPEAFQVLEDHNPTELASRIVGMVIIYPLNKEATALIESERLTGADVLPKHLVRDPRRATSFYVSFMWAGSRQERYALLKGVARLKSDWRREDTAKVFTKPTTDEAMRACRRHKFMSLQGGDPKFNEVCAATLNFASP